MRFLFGEYSLDAITRELCRNATPVHVEPQVFDLLLHLICHRERVVSKDELLVAVWGKRIVSESTLTSRINAARRAIGDSGEQQHFIRTIARKGVRFVGGVREGAGAKAARASDRAATPLAAQAAEANASGQHVAVDPAATGNGPHIRFTHLPFADRTGAGLDDGATTQQDLGPADCAPVTTAALGTAAAAERVPPRSRWFAEPRGKPSVVVLPFHNLSGVPEQEYFSDGMTEDIMTVLSKHRTLLVIARNSAFAFRARGNDLRRIGIDLGADYVVDGSVRRIEQRVRITAHLIETEGGSLLWAERYDRNLEEIFDVQDEIATTIAARIEPGISAEESLRAARKPPQAWQAWDLFHLGMKRFYKFTADDNLEAQQLLRRAVAQDPQFAQAYASLSYAIVLGMLYFDVEPADERLDEAIALARTGVELDGQDALIRFAYGRALLARRAYDDALAQLVSALELNPALPVIYCGLGDSLAYEGRFGEAVPYFQKAISLSPHDPQRWAFYSYGALAYLLAREFEQAAAWAHNATLIPNCHYWAFAHRVAALGHLQQNAGLRTATAELLQHKPAFTCGFARQRLFYIKNADHLDLYIQGLRMAGIPE